MSGSWRALNLSIKRIDPLTAWFIHDWSSLDLRKKETQMSFSRSNCNPYCVAEGRPKHEQQRPIRQSKFSKYFKEVTCCLPAYPQKTLKKTYKNTTVVYSTNCLAVILYAKVCHDQKNRRLLTQKYINIPSEKYIYVHKYVYICVYTYLCKMDEYRYYAGLSLKMDEYRYFAGLS